MPKAELILWSQIRRQQVLGQKFRRQYSVGSYVIDFYCPALKLAIEVDGESHTPETKRFDNARQGFIESYRIEFLRFTNDDIFENLDWVLDEISETIERLKKRDQKQ